jgi:hypothetical protein
MSTPNDDLASKSGVEKQVDPRDVYDAQHGKYTNPVYDMPVEKRVTVLPMLEEPSPFSVGTVTSTK